MNRRTYFKWSNAVDGDEMANITNMEGFTNFLDGMQEQTPAETVDDAPTGGAPVEPESVPGTEPETDPSQTLDPNQQPDQSVNSDNKSSAAFAQMRISNRNLQNIVGRLLQKAGVDPNLAANPDQVLSLLDDADVQVQAEETKLPPEVLQRINFLEREANQREAERNYNTALTSFNNVQKEFGLSPKDMQVFAKQLVADGVDPFVAPVDVRKEYVNRNLDTIIARKTQLAVQEALAKDTKAKTQSTQPAATKGRTPESTPDQKINTMQSFDKLLHDLG